MATSACLVIPFKSALPSSQELAQQRANGALSWPFMAHGGHRRDVRERKKAKALAGLHLLFAFGETRSVVRG